MKKNVRRALSFIVSIVMVLAVLPVFSFPMRAKAETPSNDFEYEVNEKGEITITGYTGSDTDIVIPAEIDKKQVVGVDDSVFSDNDSITSVTFVGNVNSIGQYAFKNCKALTSVTFKGNVNSIGFNAFECCEALKNVTFEGNIDTIVGLAFCDCKDLTSVSFDENVGNIGAGAFQGCDDLKSVTFEGNVGNIYVDAFVGCYDLTSVTFKGNVGSICDCAFLGHYNLTSVTFKGNVTSIDKSAFEHCKKIGNVILPQETVIADDAFENTTKIYTYGFDSDTYTGQAIPFVVKVDGVADSSIDYTVTYKDAKEIKDAGDYTAEFTMTNPAFGPIEIKHTVKPLDLDTCMVDLGGETFTYDGKDQKDIVIDAIELKNGDNTITASEGDYYYEFSNDNGATWSTDTECVNAGSSYMVKLVGASSNFNSYTTESFKISPKELTITADSDTKACDGSALTKDSYTNTALADDDSIESVTITGSQTEPGFSNNVPSGAKIVNSAGEDVTSCYAITYENGTLTVENHVFNQKVATDTYLAEEADFTHAARYYYSCKCREKGTETFEAGEPLPTYTIIFDANGGSIETVSADTNAEYKLDSLPTPSYDGYNFLGWFTNETGGDEITTDTVFGANMTIYSHWEKKEEPKPAQGGTEKPETPTEPSVPETPATPETPETPSEPDTEDVKEETKSDYLDELYALLREAIAKGEEQTINWSVGDSLPYDVMKILEENPQITLVFNYTYMGEDFNVTIRGRDVQADPKVKWCGPLYLYSIYGGYKTDENGLKESGTYIVQAGDTLSALAAKFNTTIKNLVALNNIKDENLIFIGQELKY